MNMYEPDFRSHSRATPWTLMFTDLTNMKTRPSRALGLGGTAGGSRLGEVSKRGAVLRSSQAPAVRTRARGAELPVAGTSK